ncbi:MAG: FAD-dependent oxidoreductase [Prolixibacteraceae bacterium]|nr:FAD-dependent oxidoreductase [Prolixibacteraceae bacterium]
MKRVLIALLMLISGYVFAQNNSVLIEAESFASKGGWVVDPQFVEQMGSPYLLAHGMGKPVKDAETNISIKKAGKYHVWARTKNWAPGNWEAPGRFYVAIDGKKLERELGKNPGWNWEYAGNMDLSKGDKKLSLKDLTGFEGRCDAIYLTQSENEKLPTENEVLKKWRLAQSGLTIAPQQVANYDLVVVGGGIAGCAASIAAAEQGLKVALVHDRPVLGGNASGEIRVHTLGIYGKFERILKMLDTEHYPNGSADALKEDQKRMTNVEKYKNIDLFLNFRAYGANATDGKITSVDARQTSTGESVRFEAPLFIDCTGDGWIGYWAGAEYNYGREASSKYNESWDEHGLLWSPETADNFVMGSSVLWGSENAGKRVEFPEVPWAMDVAKKYAEKNGEWQWEFSQNDLSQIEDAETIRDHMFRAIYGSFYNYKHPTQDTQLSDKAKMATVDMSKRQAKVDSLQLKWVSYLLGKRESRRLVGDYIYTFNDERNATKFEDAVVFEKREVDVHYQVNLLDDEKPNFLSEAMFYKTDQYSIPYRCFYSKNISNLFMAGRDFSCSHVGLGGPRVMRTTGQMGAAVGFAASLCKKYNVDPRDIYLSHLKEYLNLIESQK